LYREVGSIPARQGKGAGLRRYPGQPGRYQQVRRDPQRLRSVEAGVYAQRRAQKTREIDTPQWRESIRDLKKRPGSSRFFFIFSYTKHQHMIPRTEIIPNDSYNGYIALIKENDFREALKKNTRQFRRTFENIPRKKFDYAYAEGKWTI